MGDSILILGEERSRLPLYQDALSPLGLKAVLCEDPAVLPQRVSECRPAALICHARSAELALERVRQIARLNPGVAVVLIVPDSDRGFAQSAWDLGVMSLFYSPVSLDLLAFAVRQAISGSAGRGRAAEEANGAPTLFAGRCPAIAETLEAIRKIAAADCNVLITGETGTGKELAAESIHRASRRRKQTFACVNCAAIPDALLESELFGHERGAFTGADSRWEGRLQCASGGTLFLDEIGEMSLFAQAKVLRAIGSKQVQPLGSRASHAVDVRLIAATNRDLGKLVAQGSFRADLLFRLKVAQIELPPLRERKEDIRLLAELFVQQMNAVYGAAVQGFSEEAQECLDGYSWPGNVRELKNLVESVFVMQPGEWIRPGDLPVHIRNAPRRKPPASEVEQLRSALAAANWNKSVAAANLSWSRMTIYRKIAKYGIKP